MINNIEKIKNAQLRFYITYFYLILIIRLKSYKDVYYIYSEIFHIKCTVVIQFT